MDEAARAAEAGQHVRAGTMIRRMRDIDRAPSFDAQAEALGLSRRQIEELVAAVVAQERAGMLPPPSVELKIGVRPDPRARQAPRRVWILFTADAVAVRLLEISPRPL